MFSAFAAGPYVKLHTSMSIARLLPIFFTISLVFGSISAYLGWRFIGPLGLTGLARTALWLLCFVPVLLIPLGFFARFSRWTAVARDRIQWVGFLVMGWVALLLFFSIGRDLLLLVLAAADLVIRIAFPATGGLFPGGLAVWVFRSNLAILTATLVLLPYGFYRARYWLRVDRVRVEIPGLHPDLEGFRIAQISDLHIGATIKRPFLETVVAKVNALEAHCVAVTGDLVDGSVRDLREHTRPLENLRSTYGSFYCTGNHEYYSGVHGWLDEFRKIGLRVLLNEHEMIEHGAGRLLMAGVTDFNGGNFDPRHRSDPEQALAGSAAAHLRVLLAHQPRSAFAAARAGFDLQLSGHTHGGQIWPFHYFIRLQQPFRAGLFMVERMFLYVNRGTGYWGPPLRVGSPPEITLLSLHAS